MALTLETGPIGGCRPPVWISVMPRMPRPSSSSRPSSTSTTAGGIDVAFLGLAQTDGHGNVNVSKFSGRPVGCGGFINITQNAKEGGGVLRHLHRRRAGSGGGRRAPENRREGRAASSSSMSSRSPSAATTPRASPDGAVRHRAGGVPPTADGMELLEVAPGIDIERDIVAHMAFPPLMRDVQRWTPACSRPTGAASRRCCRRADMAPSDPPPPRRARCATGSPSSIAIRRRSCISNYFRWFDTASREFFTACGVPGWRETERDTAASSAPLVDAQASFRNPATYGEDIEIESWVRTLGPHEFRDASRSPARRHAAGRRARGARLRGAPVGRSAAHCAVPVLRRSGHCVRSARRAPPWNRRRRPFHIGAPAPPDKKPEGGKRHWVKSTQRRRVEETTAE